MSRFSKKKVLAEKLINHKFEQLANIVGDFLFMMEETSIKEKDYICKVSGLMDSYALRCDNVINSYKTAIVKELLDIFLELSSEINKIKIGQQPDISHFLNQTTNTLAGAVAERKDLNFINTDEIVSKTIATTIGLIMEEKSDLIQSLLESFDFNILLKDLNNNILNLNSSAAASIGGSISEIKNRNIRDIAPTFSKLSHEKDLQTIKNNTPIRNMIHEIIFSDGRVITVKLDKIPIIPRKQAPLVLSVFREIPSVANNG